jgi:glutathione S-transferase
MEKFKLTYFDFNGGRGEPARLAMRIGGIEFEDCRIPVAEWPEVKANYRYHQLPELEVDGTVLNQSNVISRYVGKLAGLYPEDDWQAAICDAVIDTADDAMKELVNTFFLEEDEKKSAREKIAAEILPLFLSGLNDSLVAAGGKYFADGRLTIADLKILVFVNGLVGGNLDYIPTTIVAEHAPDLMAHKERVENQIQQKTQQMDYA